MTVVNFTIRVEFDSSNLTHLTVEFVLLLRHRDVILQGTLHGEREIRILRLPVRVQIEAFPVFFFYFDV